MRNLTIPMALLAAILLLAGSPARAQLCGPDVKHATAKVEGKSPLETHPPAGKALVYVLSPTIGRGTHYQMKVSADRVWIGVNEAHTYFVVVLDPGAHDFCTKAGDRAMHLKVALEAGKSYFLRQYWTVDALFQGTATLMEQTPEDAAVLLPKCKRMIFWVKGRPKPKEAAG